MYSFGISAGSLAKDGVRTAKAYSGRGIGKNNPDYCTAHCGSLGPGNYGPLPPGRYKIGPAEDHPKLGPVAMPLIPYMPPADFATNDPRQLAVLDAMRGGKSEGEILALIGPLGQFWMFGRSGFFMHADSFEHPGEASEGCIVPTIGVNKEAGRVIRQRVAQDTDRDLEVRR